jgi:hypothetical protein
VLFRSEFSGLLQTVVVPYIGNGSNTIIAGGRSGSYQNQVNRNSWGEWGDLTRINFPASMSELYWQIALASTKSGTYAGADWGIVRIVDNPATKTLLLLKYINSSNTIHIFVNNGATDIGNIPCPPGGSLYWVLEIHLKIGASGIVEIRRDMNLVFSWSGDTRTDALLAGSFDINALNGGNQLNDDFILNDITGSDMNSWPGGLRIGTLVVNADDGTNQWTPSTAVAHYSTVDEVPPSAVDYLQTNTVDQVERFGMTDCPVNALVIKGFKIVLQARKDSDASPSTIATGLTIGGVDYYGTPMVLPINSCGVVTQFATSPATGLPFTPAELNAAKLIMKSAA